MESLSEKSLEQHFPRLRSEATSTSMSQQHPFQLQFGAFAPFTPNNSTPPNPSELIFGEKHHQTQSSNSVFSVENHSNIRETMQPSEADSTTSSSNNPINRDAIIIEYLNFLHKKTKGLC